LHRIGLVSLEGAAHAPAQVSDSPGRVGGDYDPAMYDQECRGVGERGRLHRCTAIEVYATDVGVAIAVGEGKKVSTIDTGEEHRIGGAVGEVDDVHVNLLGLKSAPWNGEWSKKQQFEASD
jgi:hypothetical protein